MLPNTPKEKNRSFISRTTLEKAANDSKNNPV